MSVSLGDMWPHCFNQAGAVREVNMLKLGECMEICRACLFLSWFCLGEIEAQIKKLSSQGHIICKEWQGAVAGSHPRLQLMPR